MDEIKKSLIALRGLTTCPVCYDPLASNVVSCCNGHLVCGPCRAKVNKCPTCREDFSKVKLTCLKQILGVLLHPCKYNGCNMVAANIGEHEKWCKYRPTGCKLCEWTAPICDLIDHLNANHKGRLDKTNDVNRCYRNFPMVKDHTSIKGHVYHGTFFWRVTTKSGKDNKICFKFICKPVEEIKDIFQVKIEFKSVDMTNKVKMNLKVLSDEGESVENIISFDSTMLDSFITDNDLKYTLTVVKILDNE